MGTAQSTAAQSAKNTVALVTGQKAPSPADKYIVRDAKAVTDAVKSGNQVFLEKDVRDRVSELSTMFTDFNNNDYKGLLGHIERINQALKEKGDQPFELSEQIKASLLQFHTAILSGIDTSLMGETEKNQKFVGIMNNPNESKDANLANVFRLLGDHFGRDLEAKKNQLVQAQGISESPQMQQNVETIMNAVKALKVKYKFFEYKYIELNIFLILFVQHFYKTLDSFITNVLAFNSVRDTNRERIIQDTLTMMIGILNAADLQIDPKDFAHITESMEKLRAHMDKKNKDMEANMRDLVAITTDNLSGFVNALTDATKVDLMKQLQQSPRPLGTTSAPLTGIPGMPMPGGSRQKGGFPRDGTLFPQAFYNIDKVDMPPVPGSTHGPANDS